ncbi:uncharacterized protein LOC129780630 [Toxorhynchites rutilus septentrionalis]|uniref:uncharacterized protein LOC129780630 n=1 Tax=Toxorhynchites rutilus septentrionalis TaxID=329112 RepID=UPI002478AF91|nr:uncharacterized protein LOC129780630 [Toxorhynchites rutilus septentrionalis]
MNPVCLDIKRISGRNEERDINCDLGLGAFCLADYSDNQKAIIKKYSDVCETETGISADSHIVKQAPYGGLSAKDGISRKYIVCMQRGMGFLEEDGKINVENVVNFMVPPYDRKAVEELTNDCVGSEVGSLEDKASSFYNCFFTKKKI